MLQDHAKSKAKELEDEKDDKKISNGCHVTNGNGCAALKSDPDAEMEMAAEAADVNVIDEKSTAECRPLKKPKSELEERCPDEDKDTGFGFFHIPFFFGSRLLNF